MTTPPETQITLHDLWIELRALHKRMDSQDVRLQRLDDRFTSGDALATYLQQMRSPMVVAHGDDDGDDEDWRLQRQRRHSCCAMLLWSCCGTQ